METISYMCKECGACWEGDAADAWCDECDGDNIEVNE